MIVDQESPAADSPLLSQINHIPRSERQFIAPTVVAAAVRHFALVMDTPSSKKLVEPLMLFGWFCKQGYFSWLN